MRRNEFLTELRNGLDGKVNKSELEDILRDYHELFEEGLLEGKTEEEISAGLGSPAQTVRLILSERSDYGKIVGDQKAWIHDAPFYGRMMAWLIDHCLSVFPLAFFGVARMLPIAVVWPPILLLYAVDTHPSPSEAAGAIICICYFALYHILFLVLLKGRTPGKLLLRLRVVNQDGSKPSIPQILGREMIGRLFINSITFGVSNLVSFIWCLFSKENKTVHDAVANTRVVIHEQTFERGK